MDNSTTPRPVTVEDVQRMIGSMMLEIEVLRRENAQLRKIVEDNNLSETKSVS
jgi:regulator of replication initiation timing